MKSLFIPVITPGQLSPDHALSDVLKTGEMFCHGAEGTTWTEKAIDGAPQEFHDSCKRLLSTFSGLASGVVIAGTTGEGPRLGIRQYQVLLSAMKKACPPDLPLYAGVLSGDDTVTQQVLFSQELGISNILLGINHTRNNFQRVQDTLAALSSEGRVFLYNLPTFDPADRGFILACLGDPRVVGFKDSSGDPEFFSWLLSLKDERPDLQVVHGNEQLYGELSPEEFEKVNGLVAGNANLHPALLRAYTNNPKHDAHKYGRQELHESLVGFSGRSANGKVAQIEKHIHGMKRKLANLCVTPGHPQTILVRGQDALYSHKPGSLFHGLR